MQGSWSLQVVLHTPLLQNSQPGSQQSSTQQVQPSRQQCVLLQQVVPSAQHTSPQHESGQHVPLQQYSPGWQGPGSLCCCVYSACCSYRLKAHPPYKCVLCPWN